MKFLLFDRILSFESGKTVLAEFDVPDTTHDAYAAHFSAKPVYPTTLVIESMVQVVGWLAMEARGYRVFTVLAGFDRAAGFTDDTLTPGASKLVIEATLQGTNKRSSMGEAVAYDPSRNPRGQVDRVLLAHVPHDAPDVLRARFQRDVGAP